MPTPMEVSLLIEEYLPASIHPFSIIAFGRFSQ
jgi:hypothetical protein